ncbi:unnamed protein product [Triticum turgidum subsp. durum]|uniref:Uncharacterized protein n=1 Tax=Triticum turgidum subsp. durum TaxID=4567 RepID=A0A9R0XLX6_TRITD|nr:unnamed protein product [Triticum turgidum subsp. durum]
MEREADVCNIADQAARIEAEARSVAGARVEIEQVHADVRVLAAARNELMDRLKGLREQLGCAQSNSAKSENVRSQIETMRREIQKGRAAVEFEKKAHADNLLQSKAMEKNMIAVASEIERLRGELLNAEKRATAVTTAAAVTNPVSYNPISGYAQPYSSSEATYATMYGNPEAAYAAYGSAEATYAGTYANSDAYSTTNQAQTRTDGNQHYMAQPVHYAQYEGQQQQQQQHTDAQR